MTQQIAYLEAVVGADITSFRRGMQDVRRETGLLSDTMGGLSHVGRNMTLALTAPLLAAAGASIKLAGDFDASMRNINSIAFLGEEQLKALSERTLEFGASIRSGPQAASEALYTVFSAGITDVDEAFMIMQIGAMTAEAGLANLTTTTEGLTAAALTFGDKSEAAMTRFSDATTLAVQLGVGSMDTFNTGISNVMGTGAALGANYEDLSATIAFLSQRGIDFASAGTYLNNALTKMLKPGEELDALFQTMGVKSGKDLITTFGGVEGALRAMYEEVGADETIWAKLFPDARGFKAVSRIFTMFEEDGSDAVSTFFDTFNAAMLEGGVTTAAWEQQMMSFNAQFDLLTSALQGFAITIGNVLLPIITPVIAAFTTFISQLSDADPALLNVGIAVAAVVAAIGPLLWIIGSLVTGTGLVVGGLVGLAVAFTQNFGGIKDSVTKAVTDILGTTGLQALIDGFNKFKEAVFGDSGAGENPNAGLFPSVEVDPSNILTLKSGATSVSLWSLFEATGFDPIDEFTWEDFQKAAADAGWTGGAINPDDILNLVLPDALVKDGGSAAVGWWGDLFKEVKPDLSTLAADWGLTGGGEEDTSFMGKIIAGITAAAPDLIVAFESAWNGLKTWIETTALPALDGLGAGAITSVANWFLPMGTTGEGDGPVYQALKSLLSGDIGAAASSIGQWFEDHFPTVKSAFNLFFSDVGLWIENEGLPTISRSIGFLVGKLAVAFSGAISGLWGALTGTQAIGGGSGEGSMAGVGEAMGKSVLDPLGEGYADAIAGAGLTNPIDAFFTAFSGALLVAAGVWTILPTFGTTILTKIGASIIAAMTGSTVLSGVGTFIMTKIVGSFAVAASVTNAGVIVGSAGTGLLGLLSSAFAMLGTAVTATTGFISTAAGSVVAALGSAIALAPIAAGIALGTLLYMVIPQEWKDAIHNILGSIIDGATGGEGTGAGFDEKISNIIYEAVGGAMVMLGDDRGYGIGAMSTNVQERLNAAGISIDTTQIPITTVGPNLYSSVMTAWQGSQGDFGPSTIGMGQPKANPFTYLFAEMGTGIVQTVADDLAITDKTPIFDSMADAEAAKLDPSLTAMGTSMADNIIAAAVTQGELDGQKIVDGLVTPLANGFTLAFGEESPAILAFGGFVTKVDTGTADMGLDLVTLGTNVGVAAGVVARGFDTMAARAVISLGGILSKVNSLAAAIAALAAAANGLNNIEIDTDIPGVTPDANASGGTAKGWSMVGERGPELVHFGQQGTVLPTRMLRDGMGGGQSSGGGTVNVYGITGVDEFLFELDRRGYEIPRR